MRRLSIAIMAAALLSAGTVFAQDIIRIAAQKTGTLAWELDVIRAYGLDKTRDLAIELTELASPEAGKIALRGGSADIIVSDTLGAELVFYPYSTALGAVMAPDTSPIKSLVARKNRKLGVAGGAIDKSWLLLQAAMRRDGIDLKTAATIVYGAPALLAEKAIQGEVDATLNYWNFCAALEAKGFRRVAGVEDVLPKLGSRAVRLWSDMSSTSDGPPRTQARWSASLEPLARPRISWRRRMRNGNGLRHSSVRATRGPSSYRNRYRDGIPRRSIAEEKADARTLYDVLAKIGGRELVGPTAELEPGTFYNPRSGP